jgi:hypothetical protein
MREILDERKTYDRDVARFTPELQKLYTVESFSSKEAMHGSIDSVRGVTALDQQYSQQLETLPQRVQARLDRSGLPASFANSFMEGIRKSYVNSEPLTLRRQAVEAERQWADTTVTFYEYALANADQIRVEGSHLAIRNGKVRSEFNEQMKKSDALRDSMLTLNKKLENAQRKVMRQTGVTPKDVGLEDPSQPAKR